MNEQEIRLDERKKIVEMLEEGVSDEELEKREIITDMDYDAFEEGVKWAVETVKSYFTPSK